MTTKVTKESLAENIGRLESYGDLSLNEEYQLKAYRLLLELMPKDCPHAKTLDIFNPNSPTYATVVCVDCGAELGDA
ncbi:hypothetical protein MT554_004288 [Salmonella enterica]|nr:hypothetical protein [Salmonella enterica]